MPAQRKQSAEQAQKVAVNAQKTADALKIKTKQAQQTAEQAKAAVTEAKKSLQQTRQAGKQAVNNAKMNIKTAEQTGKQAIHQAENQTVRQVENQAAQTAEKQSAQTIGNKAAQQSGSQTVQSAGKQSAQAIGNKAAQESGSQTVQTAGSRAAQTIGKKTAQQSGGQTVQSVGNQTAQAVKVKQSALTSIKTKRQTEKTIKTSNSAKKGAIKSAKKSVKTAERSAQNTVKTAKHTAKTAQKSAQTAAKSAKEAARASKTAAKTAEKATRAAAKATVATVKAAIAALRGLTALIAAGGWIAVIVTIIICLIGLLVGSSFGIFFSGQDSGTGRAMPAVVSALTTEFYDRIEEIKSGNSYDVLDVGAMSINWTEVLSVYAVKINRLRGVLNDMANLSYSTQTETQERTVTDNDGNENTETRTVTTLVITLNQKNASDMAAQYSFNDNQTEQLNELLSPEYSSLWAALLGGYVIGNGAAGTPDGSRIPTDIFSWPMEAGFNITSSFGYRSDPFTGETKLHGGTDIGAPTGTPILAAADGVVTVANSTDSWGGSWGYYVKIRHNDTFDTLYAHCSAIAVTKDQEVKKGDVIAYVGLTGATNGPHLHFEVYQNGIRVNPMGYFSAG